MPLLPPEQTLQGYESPVNTQFSVFLDNRCGKLLELLEIFEGQALQVVALSVNDSADHAVVRLVTTNSELARKLLHNHQIPFSEAAILIVELRPGRCLATLCQSLLSAELNIHYAYPLLAQPHHGVLIVLHTDDQVLAGQILRRKLFNLLAENDLRGPDSLDSGGETRLV